MQPKHSGYPTKQPGFFSSNQVGFNKKVASHYCVRQPFRYSIWSLIIDSLPAVPNRDQLTHKDLHAHFSTGQSILLSGSGRDKKYGYRNGIQTDLGDIRNDVWRDLVRELIVRSHEEDLFDKLLEWEKEHTYWLKTKAELEHYTLELYAARIFDNPKWVDYEAFAKHYGYQPQSYEG